MTKQNLQAAINVPDSRRFLPVLLILFAGSGCSALIYEIVWFQLLQLVIGSSAVSLGVLLGTFMGGMCLGSVCLPRFLSARRHPMRVYAGLELAIGVLGIAVLLGMPYVDRFYSAVGGHGLFGILLRGVVCGVCLLPPTVLMGATLPAIARWVETTPAGVSWLGFFYGGNIAGAVFGCLLAGFYLLRVHDMATAVYVAATMNATVASISLGLAAVAPHYGQATPAKLDRPLPEAGAWSVYVTIALSGACALAAEVIWTRLLSLLLGATVYTFSIILAVFLLGLGIGSSAGALLARGAGRPRVSLGVCQVLLAAAIAWTGYMLARSLPYWPINPSLSRNPWHSFQLDLARCCWAVLPATCLWGASFPLALAALATRDQDGGRLVGGVYAANTIGAIVGALGSSLILIRWLGTQHGQQLLIGVSACAGLLMLLPHLPPGKLGSTKSSPGTAPAALTSIVRAVIAITLSALAAWSVPRVPGDLVAYGRTLATYTYPTWTNLYVGEGMNSSVAVTEEVSGVRNFHVSGKVEASTIPEDMRLQRMLGHIPALVHAKPRAVLIVGCGAGVTAGSFVVHPDIERIVICEIEPLVPRVASEFFAKENYDVVHDPRVEIIYDDARHYILTTAEQFDVITSDPIHPWVKGSATLYTREYFELCKRHLKPGGMITQWVPLYESSRDVVKSELATFFEVFPNGTIWSNESNNEGYDVVVLGSNGAMTIDLDELQKRLERVDHRAVAESLKNVGIDSTYNLFNTYAGQASDLKLWLQGAEINRDSNLRLQYLAGMWLNVDHCKTIYKEMLSARRFPEELFVGSGVRTNVLRGMLNRARRESP